MPGSGKMPYDEVKAVFVRQPPHATTTTVKKVEVRLPNCFLHVEIKKRSVRPAGQEFGTVTTEEMALLIEQQR